MEAAGIGIDGDALQISEEFASEFERLERECYELAGRSSISTRPLQLRKVLFDDLKLRGQGIEKDQEWLLNRRRYA